MALGLGIIVLSSATAQAAQSGTVTLTGKVLQACNIIVTAASGAANIADISVGDTNRAIATVNESCNDPSGYKVEVKGSHSGDHTGLFVDTISGDSHPFSISYDGAPVTTGIVTDVTAPGINLNKDVRISYNADAGLTPSAGFTYGETLTFTITAK